MTSQVTLRIVLERPPKDVDFGLQKGKGSAYETVQIQRSDGSDSLRFEVAVEVKTNGARATPVLTGPYVQGPPDARFVYIDIGTYAGQRNTPWSRRLKIPLTGITAAMLDPARVLEVRVPGTAKDGGPNCATIKPFDGWKVKSR